MSAALLFEYNTCNSSTFASAASIAAVNSFTASSQRPALYATDPRSRANCDALIFLAAGAKQTNGKKKGSHAAIQGFCKPNPWIRPRPTGNPMEGAASPPAVVLHKDEEIDVDSFAADLERFQKEDFVQVRAATAQPECESEAS
jgi:hypothetical protein